MATFALVTGRGVSCWGYNVNGLLGVGSTHTAVTVPRSVTGTRAATSVSTGDRVACAPTPRQTLCWGQNFLGGLGDGTLVDRTTPTPVVHLAGTTSVVATSGVSSCAVTTLGALFCWGYNAEGQLGNGTRTDSTTPTRVFGVGTPLIGPAHGVR